MAREWESVFPADEIEIYKESGFNSVGGTRLGLGERPAVIVIDIQHRTVGDDKPILQSIRTSGYPTSCGEIAWTAIRQTARLIELGRKHSLPIIYAIIERAGAIDAGLFGTKLAGITSSAIHKPGTRGTQIPDEIAPQPGDTIISKRQSSAFFGTSLVTQLNMLRVDSLVIAGCSTSGCVRATAIDAFSYGIKPTIVEECVYDRSRLSHNVSLFEMNAKYADVLTLAELGKVLAGKG
jgi:maleamate amidohydrolase